MSHPLGNKIKFINRMSWIGRSSFYSVIGSRVYSNKIKLTTRPSLSLRLKLWQLVIFGLSTWVTAVHRRYWMRRRKFEKEGEEKKNADLLLARSPSSAHPTAICGSDGGISRENLQLNFFIDGWRMNVFKSNGGCSFSNPNRSSSN